MAADPLSPPLKQDPPGKLVTRTARVATNVTNTIRVPHDHYVDHSSDWYNSASTATVQQGNQVKYLLHGSEAFPEMQAAIRTATGPGHFIYMLNWFCDVDFDLTTGAHKEPGPPTSGNTQRSPDPSTLRYFLQDAAMKGVMIRAMFWKCPATSQNYGATRFLNSQELQMFKPLIGGVTTVKPDHWVKMEPCLPNSAAILDDTGDAPLLSFLSGVPILSIFTEVPRAIGSSHQKVLCVYGEQGLVCFCGGIDFNPDRIIQPSTTSILHSVNDEATPLHDVHCRIVGPAAIDIVQTFVDRWTHHPKVKNLKPVQPAKEKIPPTQRQEIIMPPTPASNGQHYVQIGRTFRKGLYSFNPAGEFTGADMIVQAIGQAKRFIYTECQYFTGDPAAYGGDARLEGALIKALQTIDHLTVVVTHWERSDLPTVNEHRRTFFQDLINAGGDKVRIFALQPDGNNSADFKAGKVPQTYVHAKIWVMDDEFAVIGSLNSNRRSWLHDAEIAAGIYETSLDTQLHYRLAHMFRIKLWAEHLNMAPLDSIGMLNPVPSGSPELALPGEAELADGVASGAHWLRLPTGARVTAYDMNDHGDVPMLGIPIIGLPINLASDSAMWNGVFDPSH